MISRRKFAWLPPALLPWFPLAGVALLLSLSGYGCKSHAHTSDPSLRKIDEMLNAQLPPGTPRALVDHFLRSRGYNVENAHDQHSLVAVVRHIDTDTLRPATARVTFHFDSNDKLISYELQAAPDATLRP